MHDQAIFVLSGDELTPLTETRYENEALLHQALEDYPDLIAGIATSGEGGRLLLVRREMPVPGPSGSTSLSLDHLFVDSAGVPVLVEAKRSSDTRSRREVVAQMLDYAANGIAYWPPDRLRAIVEEGVAPPQHGADDKGGDYLQTRLGIAEDADRYWRTVEDNLRAGRIRLIFLAGRLTSELVRIIEFLNEQMRDTEVLGIEVPQYKGEGTTTVFVPRVVGRTSAAVDMKGGGSKVPWTKDSLLLAAREICTDLEVALVERLLDHVVSRKGRSPGARARRPGSRAGTRSRASTRRSGTSTSLMCRAKAGSTSSSASMTRGIRTGPEPMPKPLVRSRHARHRSGPRAVTRPGRAG
jgi:hypothetical protein